MAAGCLHCYAEHLMDHRYHRVQWGAEGTRVKTKTWKQPLAWDRRAAEQGTKERVFCASLADVYEDREEVEPWRRELFSLIDRTPNLIWMLLTKRPENAQYMTRLAGGSHDAPRANLWIGTSVAIAKDVYHNLPLLAPASRVASKLFVSAEPQVGEIWYGQMLREHGIGWLIVGGESAQGGAARPFDLSWAWRCIRAGKDAGIPVFVKQLGSNPWHKGQPFVLKDSHGGDWAEWPRGLRVRQIPSLCS